MVNTSKILTVSYGTFSCTLEGFDDSFGTMKAIAEYFRDLASNDRYFGAEPPTPDAEMLARIAEREIARQVEARQEHGQIVLRAADQPAAADTTAPADAAPEAPATEAPATPPEPDADSEQDAEATPDTGADAEAAAEQQAQPEAPPEAETAAAEEPGPEPETVPEAEATQEAVPEEAEADAAPAAEIAPDTGDEPEPDAIAPQPALHTPAQAESVAAKLRRIRAVVSQGAAPATAAFGYSEDEHADDGDDVEASAVEASAQQAPGTDADATAATEDRPDTAMDQGSDAQPAANVEDAAQPAATAQTEAEDTTGTARTGVLKVSRADFEEVITADDAAASDAPDTPDEAAADDSAAEPADKGRDANDGWEADWNEDEESSLSPEEEAELRRELAQVEAELGATTLDGADGGAAQDGDADDDDDEVGSIFAETSAEEHESRQDRIARRERLYRTADEQDMNRLIAKTQSEMAEPQAANRRNAIAHLRAAVAATTAEIEAGQGRGASKQAPPPASEDRDDDGAGAVRPRRPTRAEGATTRRPAAKEGATPLKLVAEQRIDAPEPSQPVKPRRVSRAALDEVPDDTSPRETPAQQDGFAEFATSVGAHDLGEILEAAAAYMTFVEDRSDFSRPQLMTRVRALQGDAFSREDGLRSFGQLLRSGKLRKIGGGRFTASREIGFQQEARRAG